MATELRVINEDGSQAGIMSKSEALNIAREAGLSLVEISPNASPPVAKIMDYGKFSFEQKKKVKKNKAPKLKEISLRHVTEEADYRVKLRNLVSFLQKGNKVKVSIRFKGREITHSALGAKLLERVRIDTEEYGTPEQMPKLEGRQMVMLISPLRGNKQT